jgi:membrane protein YqaA with SNARE-associated domain
MAPVERPPVLLLFVYAFVSNVALAVVPHEPVVIWYGARLGIWPTAAVATAGTLVASWLDYALFGSFIARRAERGGAAWLRRTRAGFARAPFAIVALSGLTPLPFWPFKALAFAARYPLPRYLAAVGVGRFPRYILLAWLGTALVLPPAVLWALFITLFLLSLRTFLWNRANGNSTSSSPVPNAGS